MAIAYLTPAARQDLSVIWDYTNERWGIEQAEKYTEHIIEMCAVLTEPVTGSLSADDIRSGYQKVLYGKHLIFFRIEKEVIEVVRILHQSMDVEL